MPDIDPDHHRKFHRDRARELRLVRIVTDRQTDRLRHGRPPCTTSAQLVPLYHFRARQNRCGRQNRCAATTLVVPNGNFQYLTPLASLGEWIILSYAKYEGTPSRRTHIGCYMSSGTSLVLLSYSAVVFAKLFANKNPNKLFRRETIYTDKKDLLTR